MEIRTIALPQAELDITFEEVKKEFELKRAWGILTSVDLGNCNPELVRSEHEIKSYVKQLCELIEAKRFGETTLVHFGEDERIAGYSMVQLIETSLISGHFVNAVNNIYIDVFSCKSYDPAVVAAFTSAFFEAEKVTAKVIMRR